jgi:hypothetical protein
MLQTDDDNSIENETGENLKVVWAEFSTLGWTVLLHANIRGSLY